MLNAASIGLGWWGRHIATTLNTKSQRIRSVRAVDIDVAAAQPFAAELGLDLGDDFDAVLADPAVDAVIIATPHSRHEEQIVRAAVAGKHVFCEKPLTLTKTGAERAVAACARAGVVLGVGHERRFEPSMKEIKRLVDTGALGTLMHVESNFSHDILAGLDAANWRVSAAEAPAAGMTATGIHLTDAYLDMFGPIASVYARAAARNTEREVGDVLSIHFDFESGMTGYFNTVLETPFYGVFRLFGTKAWVEARETDHPSQTGGTHFTLYHADDSQETRAFDWEDTVLANLEAFARAVAGDGAYPFTGEQLIQNIAVFEAVCRSAETGQAQKI